MESPQDAGATNNAAATSFLQGLGAFKGIKTFRGRPSVYGVIAEKNGLGLAITPKIALGIVTGVDLTVRVQKMEEWANLSDGGQLFGFPEVEEAGPKHSRTQMFVAVASGPTTPYAVGVIVRDNKIVEQMVAALAARVEAAGASLSVPQDVVVEYISNAFEDKLPTTEPKAVISEYPVCVGYSEINARINAVVEAMQPPKDPGQKAEGGNPEGEQAGDLNS